MAQTDTQLECTSAPQEMKNQSNEWENLVAQAESIVRIKRGIRLDIAPRLTAAAADLAGREMECCSFLHIDVEPADDRTSVTITTETDVGQRLLEDLFTAEKLDMDLAIGDVAKQAGVSVAAIRYYEERGIVTPAGRVGGKRRFGTDAVGRLSFVRQAKDVGFSLDEIGHILNGDAWPEVLESKLVELSEQRAKLDSMISLLSEAKRCGCDVITTCERRNAVQLTCSNPSTLEEENGR